MAEDGSMVEVQNVVKRGILVEEIPFVTEDSEQIQDKLEIYFQGADGGSGEVERIICPLQGNLCKAIVIFRSTEDLLRVISRGKHEFAGEPIDVSELPREFVHVSADIETFYWDAMKKSKSKAVADEITEIVGKSNCKRKPYGIKRVKCSIDQLQEIENRILGNGPFGGILKSNLENQTTKQSILERTVSISDIPYLTDDRQQLEKELQTYFKRVLKKEIQELVCGIKGDLKRALAIFPTDEDMNLFLSMHEKGEDEARFFDEKLTATKVPPVISNVSATCNDFYFKLMPREKQKKMMAVMLERCGSSLTIKDDVLIGSLHQVFTARTIILETLGLQQQEDSHGTTTENQFVIEDKQPTHAPSDRVKEFVADEQFSASPEENKLNEATLGSSTDPNLPISPKDTISQDHDSVTLKDATNGNVKNKPREGKTSNAISKYPGKAVQQVHEKKKIETSEVSENTLGVDVNQQAIKKFGKDSTPDEYYLPNKSPNRDPSELKKSHTNQRKHNESTADMSYRSNRHSLQDTQRDLDSTSKSHEQNQIQRNSNQTQKQREDKFFEANGNLNDGVEKRSNQGTKYSSSASKAEYGTDDTSGNESNQRMSGLSIKTPPSMETIESLTSGAEKQDDTTISQVGNRTRKRSPESVQGDFNPSYIQEKDNKNTKQTGLEVDNEGTLEDGVALAQDLPNNAEPGGNEYTKVDKVKYEYVVTKHKEEFENIQTAHGVSISAKSGNVSKPSELIVEVKKVKKSGRKSKKQTQDEVLKAQKEFITLYRDTISCITTRSLDCSRATKLKRAKEMLKKKFDSILLVKESETQYIFCGRESIVLDGIREFRISAGIVDETGNVEGNLSVDKIAFQYLKHVNSNELNAIEKKYNVYFDLKESSSKPLDEKQLYVKPRKSGGQKKRVTPEEIESAKDEFVTLYQRIFYVVKRVQLTCQGVSKELIKEAKKVTTTTFSKVLILKREGDDYMLCGEEKILKDAVKEFRRVAGLLPPSRKLKKTNSSEPPSTESTTTDTTSFNQPKQNAIKGAAGLGQVNVVLENLPSVFVIKESLEVIVLKGDITKQQVNVIVNAANGQLKHGGGVAKAIALAAGPQLQKDCDRLMFGRPDLMIGECVDTKGYNLPCDLVVHTVGPFFNKKVDKDISRFSDLLRKTFLNVLIYADGKKGVKTVAIPLISSGNYGGPKECCTEALASALSAFSKLEGRKDLKRVYLVNVDEEATLALQQTLTAKFPSTPKEEIRNKTNASDHTQTMQTVRRLKTGEGLELVIVKGDITICQVDAIVNAANANLRHGSGVASAISKAAGKQLREECERLMSTRQPLQVGEVAETGSYNLPCKTVIHAVGPRFREGTNKEVFYSSLKGTFLNVLNHANIKVEAQTVALPLISSGVFGGCKQLCSKALVEAVKEFSENASTLIIKTLYLVNIDVEATKAIDEVFKHYFIGDIHSTNQETENKRYQFNTSGGIQILVGKSDITKQPTDAIVNPTDHNLSNEGGVSKAISKTAGFTFQTECEDKMKHRTHLKPAEVIYTTGGNLPCRYVLHVVSPFFNKSHPGSEYTDELQTTIIACLRMANNTLKLTSVALPLIGSGRHAAPLDVCATAMARAIEVVSKNEKTLRLKQVAVVGTEDKAILAVRQVFGHHFTADNLGKKWNADTPLRASGENTVTDVVATTAHMQSRNTIDPICIFQTDEGIQVVIEKGDLIQQPVDVLFVNTDTHLKHNEEIAGILYQAAGPELRIECDATIKKRKYLKPGDTVKTGGHKLFCKEIVHFVGQVELWTDLLLLSILLHAKNTLRAKTAAFLVNRHTLQSSSEPVFAEALVKAVKRLSTYVNQGPFQKIFVVSNDEIAISTYKSVFSHHLRVLTPITTPINQAPAAIPPGMSNGRNNPLSQRFPDQTQHGPLGYQAQEFKDRQQPFSTTATGTSASYQGASAECQKCQSSVNVKPIESCGHIFCQTCITNRIAFSSSCLICKALYCVAEEKTLKGTMTYYVREDITLGGSSAPGAILIVYEFLAGIQGSNHPRPGKAYNGTRALAYLPYNTEGCSVVTQLRKAFVAGLTFDVKPNRKGGFEVSWSGLIPHKRNSKGGKTNHGYPDDDYLSEVKAALDKELRPKDHKSTGNSFV